MKYDSKRNSDFKKYDNKKDETPQDKFTKMYEEFKMEVIRSGILQDYKDHEYYIKPSQKKRMKIAEAKMKAKQNRKRRDQGK